MAIARITGQGLAAIAVLVALLWGCLIAEHMTIQRANAVAYYALRANRAMKVHKSRRIEPAAAPVHGVPRPAPARLG